MTKDEGDHLTWNGSREIIQERTLRTQGEIMASWKWDGEHPFVSICCPTYNHEDYIRDALSGFLMQETHFSIEILVNDDASTDKTADVIREFEQEYPLIVKPIYETTNQYSLGRNPLEPLHARSKGKYIAVCEGDDYWTDANKLSIQVAFLETHPEYVISGHDAFIIDEENNVITESKLPSHCKRGFSSEELVTGQAWILTLSWVFRNIAIEYPPEARMVENGDRFYVSLLGHYGRSRYHADIKPACYRVHRGGVWSTLSNVEQRNAHINTLLWTYRYYARTGKHQVADRCWDMYVLKVLVHARPCALVCLLVKTSFARLRRAFAIKIEGWRIRSC